jgi:hypothetical protein
VTVSISHDIVGMQSEPYERFWYDRDVLLYALADGAGTDRAGASYEVTEENNEGSPHAVLPTSPVTTVPVKPPNSPPQARPARMSHRPRTPTAACSLTINPGISGSFLSIIEAVCQMREEPSDRQVADVNVAALSAMGGVMTAGVHILGSASTA